jgi:crossover junction endodeoxyribonuclease RuvC
MRYIGIDPGKQGSVSVLDEKGQLISVTPTPVVEGEYDIAEMINIIDEAIDAPEESFVILERAQAMPGQGVVSMFEFGRGYGIWLGIINVFLVPYQIVHARTWTKKMLEGAPGEGKERAYHVARNLFPSWNPKLKKEYQFCDSILLAEFGRRIHDKN